MAEFRAPCRYYAELLMRYESAAAEFGQSEVIEGNLPLGGGWRVYSSGPGIFLRLVVECLLGVRRRADLLEIDPSLLLPWTGCKRPCRWTAYRRT